MIKTLRNYFLFAFISLFSVNAFAQEITSEQALKLVGRNSAYIGVNADDIENMRVTNAYKDKLSGMKLIYLQQSYQGVPVYNSLQVVVIKEETVQSVTGDRIAKMSEKVNVDKVVPSITAKKAVGFSARFLDIPMDFQLENSLTIQKISSDKQTVTFGMSPISREPVTSDLMWVPLEDGSIKLAWQVKVLPQNTPDYWLVFVNAQNGEIIQKVNLNISCSLDNNDPDLKTGTMSSINNSDVLFNETVNLKNTGSKYFDAITSSNYRVIPFPAESMVHPNGTPVVVNNPWLNAGALNPATTYGWHTVGTLDYSNTRGNNVWAKEDTLSNNGTTGYSPNSTTTAPNLNFDFGYDETQHPAKGNNLNFSITNLFYWNNIMHDITYQYGFDEVSGNFQSSNISRGGLGNDHVIAEAQDGGGTNNANFSTGPDGNSPRMQMYLFDGPSKILFINSPSSVSGFVAAQEGEMSANNKLATKGPVTGDLVLYKDAPSGSINFACGAAFNAAELAGKIALIERGNCAFADKVLNAQQAGAKGVIIFDNVVTDVLILMGGEDNSIIIPAVAVLKNTGDALKSLLATQTVNLTLQPSLDKLDGALDNSIIAHEYTHGISNRLTGGPGTVTCLQNREQMGEGWSDYYALMLTTDWATATVNDGTKTRSIGSFVMHQDPATSSGIRTYPYSTDMLINPLTYARLTNIPTDKARPHEVGEIWAATLWDMTWDFIGMEGINPDLYNADGKGGNTDALKLVTFAMKIQPCSPGFLDGRNAILKADELLFNGKYACAIWKSFARRGMGIAAKQGDPDITTDQQTSFAVPSGAKLTKSVDKQISGQNGILTYTFTVKAQCANISNYKIVDTLANNVTWVSGGNYDAANRTVTFTVASLPANQAQTFTFKSKINTGTYYESVTLFSETVENSYVPITLVANPPFVDTWDASPVVHSSPYSLKATPTTTASEQTLTSLIAYSISGHVEFSFWNYYNTETSRDGGVVELSTDDGTSWFDAGPFMIKNGYNSTMMAATSLDNKEAFSGKSDGFIQTIINLSSFAGKDIKFRFRFVADNTIKSNGWYIDDILITNASAVYNLASLYSNTNLLQNISDTVTAITTEVLPLVWGDFVVLKDGQSASLKWTTLQESNTDKFVGERSIDGINFTAIGTVRASGNSNREVSYSLTDPSPSTGVNYYRIVQADMDGRITYSEVRTLVIDGNNRLITISPNPAKDKIVVELAGNRDAVQIDLLSTSGQKLATYHAKLERNKIDLPVLAPGVYYLRVAGKNYTGIKKLIIE